MKKNIKKQTKKLIFVYNANSGFISTLKDTVQKTISPNTYQCKLCQITFGAFNQKDEWKEFIENLSLETEFLHKDEFLEKYGINKDLFPNVYLSENNKLTLLINASEMNSAKNIEDLKNLVHKKIKTLK